MQNTVTVGKILRKFREDRKQTQEKVSSKAGIGRSQLSAIERGERKPTLDTFCRIADALQVQASAILAAVEDMEEDILNGY